MKKLLSIIIFTITILTITSCSDIVDKAQKEIQTEQNNINQAKGIGALVHDAGIDMKVIRVTTNNNINSEINALGKYVIIELSIKNITEKPINFKPEDQELITVDLNKINTSRAAMKIANKNNDINKAIEPDSNKNMLLVFDIPTETQISGIRLHGKMLSPGVMVKFNI